MFHLADEPEHTSRLCQGCMIKRESDGVLHLMAWSPQSADLNPNEINWTAEQRVGDCWRGHWCSFIIFDVLNEQLCLN